MSSSKTEKTAQDVLVENGVAPGRQLELLLLYAALKPNLKAPCSRSFSDFVSRLRSDEIRQMLSAASRAVAGSATQELAIGFLSQYVDHLDAGSELDLGSYLTSMLTDAAGSTVVEQAPVAPADLPAESQIPPAPAVAPVSPPVETVLSSSGFQVGDEVQYSTGKKVIQGQIDAIENGKVTLTSVDGETFTNVGVQHLTAVTASAATAASGGAPVSGDTASDEAPPTIFISAEKMEEAQKYLAMSVGVSDAAPDDILLELCEVPFDEDTILLANIVNGDENAGPYVDAYLEVRGYVVADGGRGCRDLTLPISITYENQLFEVLVRGEAPKAAAPKKRRRAAS